MDETWRPAPPAPPQHSNLSERQVLIHRLVETPPTVAELVKHATKFGTECVVETAVELGYTFDSCVRLQDACDRADLAELRRHRPNAKLDKRKLSEDRVTLLMGADG